jgi:hypothetical protein
MKYFLPVAFLLLIAGTAFAQTDYTPLAPIPQLQNAAGKVNINTFLPGLVKFAIGLAAAMAVVRIVIAGFTYISTDAWGKKSDAKTMIEESLLGLLLAIGAYTILYTVNPQLVQFNLSTPNLPRAGSIDGGLGTGGTDGDTSQCANCIPVPDSIPHKTAAQNGCALPGPCVLHATLVNKLTQLKDSLQRQGVSWQVTEMYPPTVQHKDTCHSNGTCFDAKIIAPNNRPTIEVIKKFLDTIKTVFGSGNYVYEVPTSDQNRLDYLEDELDDYNIEDYTTTTGESVHVELGALSASNLGCINDCATLTPVALPTDPAACPSNCFLYRGLLLKLQTFSSDMLSKYGWQIIQAYPPIMAETDVQFKPGSSAGKAVDIKLTVAQNNIEAIAYMLNSIKNKLGLGYKYNVCDSARRTELQNHALLAQYKNNIGGYFCPPAFEAHPEAVRAYIY